MIYVPIILIALFGLLLALYIYSSWSVGREIDEDYEYESGDD